LLHQGREFLLKPARPWGRQTSRATARHDDDTAPQPDREICSPIFPAIAPPTRLLCAAADSLPRSASPPL
jgi:hypothetical protein